MLPPSNGERGQVAAQGPGRVVDGEDDPGQPHAPVVPAAVGEGPRRVAQRAIAEPIGLGVGVLMVGRADAEARVDAAR